MDCYLLVIIKEDVWISTAGAELERLIFGQVSNLATPSVCWSVKSGHRSLFLLLMTQIAMLWHLFTTFTTLYCGTLSVSNSLTPSVLRPRH